jgi:hypothetical protein
MLLERSRADVRSRAQEGMRCKWMLLGQTFARKHSTVVEGIDNVRQRYNADGGDLGEER